MIDRERLLRVVGTHDWRVVHDRPGTIATGCDEYDTCTATRREQLCERLRAMGHFAALLEGDHDER